MTKLKILLATVAFCGGLSAVSASAMPVAKLSTDLVSNIEDVRWVCGPYRCWWRPGPYWGPRWRYRYRYRY